MRAKSSTLGRLLVLAWGLQALPVPALDLLQAYEQALRHDPTHRAAADAVTAGRELALQGDALWRPHVSLAAGVSRVDDHALMNVPPEFASILPPHQSGNVRQSALQLTQALIDGGAQAGQALLHLQTELAETEYAQAQQDLVRRVAEVYLGVLSAQEELRVADAEKATMDRQLERAQARLEVGQGRLTELQEVRARDDLLRTKVIAARSRLELRQAQFQETAGVPAAALAPLAPGFRPGAPEPDSLPAWQSRGEDHALPIRVRLASLAMSRAEMDKYRLRGRPSLDLAASYTVKGATGTMSPLEAPPRDHVASVALQLTVPLYAGGDIDSHQRAALAREQQAEDELAAARRDARLQVQDAYLAMQTDASSVAALEQARVSARTALEATTLGRDVGNRSELDVLDAQQRAFGSELDLVHARFDYLLARVHLAAAVGELGEPDLRVLNAAFAAH